MVVSTIFPLVAMVCIFSFMYLARMCTSDKLTKKAIRNNCVEVFLAMTFLVFASVSKTIFDAFNCSSYGDDPEEYLFADMSIDCSDMNHKLAQKYACIMMLVYPLGIPLLYAVLLFQRRNEIKAEDRATNASLIKTGFLWEMYEPDTWWFEIFECLRRLAMSGLLVFVRPGSTSQVVLALILAMASVVLYTHLRPFVEDEDDNLAVVCQVSVFITIFAALIVRIEVDQIDSYNQDTFGIMLIGVNLVGVLMVSSNLIHQPLLYFIKLVSSKNRHDGYIKGLTVHHDRNSTFIKYFENLALSSQEASGFSEIPLRGSRGSKWSSKTHAKLEWRNANGYGPIDEGRVTFTITCPLHEVREYILNRDCKLHPGYLDHFDINTEPSLRDLSPRLRLQSLARRGRENRRVIYTGREMPFPLQNRDYLMEQVRRA
ncbi:hypothetical protein TL16_g08175 [Triparma laevis f. inornata]|uniref:TRP C-terminal domain-containing protein n=1 Tax=Triparma laevis f. inornata TaxID=1714386 RepID=A0A9W7B0Y9_9STRA|nr:hypothetical protein TL16_g08175 [Triparma laevis f. inornata]